MSDYVRTTRQCTLESMRPELSAGIRDHIERHELGDLPGAALMCVETVSVKAKKGLFGKEETIYCGILLTPQWLVWALSKNGVPAGVVSARLRNLEVQDHEKTDMNKLVPDSGLHVLGEFTGMLERGSIFIGLGTGSAALEFRRLLKEALRKANV